MGFPFKKNKVDLEEAMKVNFKVKMKVTIEFLVEIYFKNDLHFFENILPEEIYNRSGPFRHPV